MSRKDKIFSVVIKVIFIFAFGAFLAASIHHIATFYANFEPASIDMIGSYALAIALDGTALTLTIGVMFFNKSMPTYAKVIIWFFILALTGYSWVVNWEYAARFQSSNLTTNPTLEWLNPILASSFAFLNLAYAVVSEFFNVRVKTVEELQTELTSLTERASLENQIENLKKNTSGPGLIQRAKSTAIELKLAAKEVVNSEANSSQIDTANSDETDDTSDDKPAEKLPDTDPEIETVERPDNEGQPRKFRLTNQQKRYTPAEAATLRICKEKGVKIRDIKAAISAGTLKANLNGTFSKTALENWLKMLVETAA
jgi:hypothetical protein